MSARPARPADRRSGVTDPALLDALRVVRRSAFVPPEYVDAANEDRPVPILHGQVTVFRRTPEGLDAGRPVLPARFVRLRGHFGYM